MKFYFLSAPLQLKIGFKNVRSRQNVEIKSNKIIKVLHHVLKNYFREIQHYVYSVNCFCLVHLL